MKKLIALILCVILSATLLVSCGAPKDLDKDYLKGKWVAECGLADVVGDELEELGVDIKDTETKMSFVMEFEDGSVKMYVDEESLDKYFDEAIEGSDASEVKDMIKESFKGESGYSLENNLVNVSGTEYKYSDGALICEEPELTFVKQ